MPVEKKKNHWTNDGRRSSRRHFQSDWLLDIMFVFWLSSPGGQEVTPVVVNIKVWGYFSTLALNQIHPLDLLDKRANLL